VHSVRTILGTVGLGSAALAALAVACGAPALPRPALVAHRATDLVPIATPPPPARMEIIPTRPRVDGVVWLDGEWTFHGKRARWRRGRWVVPPHEARYAPWTEVRGPDAQLYFAPGKWVDARGEAIPEPPALATAPASRTTVFNDLGEEEDVGRDLVESGGAPRDGGAR
jgi:hypothetical protein